MKSLSTTHQLLQWIIILYQTRDHSGDNFSTFVLLILYHGDLYYIVLSISLYLLGIDGSMSTE